MRFLKVTMAAAVLASGMMTPALAAPTHIGTYKDWSAFWLRSGSEKTCFMLSEPKDKNPKNVKRGKVFLFVSHADNGTRKNEVNIQTGYPYKRDGTVSVKIGKDKFTFFTENEDAWIADEKQHPKMIGAMRKGSRLTVTGTSQRGTRTVDHYSLSGFTKAYQAISRECGVN